MTELFEPRRAVKLIVPPILTPGQTLYTQNFDVGGGVDGWVASPGAVANVFFAANAHSISNYMRQSGSTVGQQVATRSLSGFAIGESYTFTAWLAGDGSAAVASNVKIGVTGLAYSTPTAVSTGVWAQQTYTFTATATTHILRLEYTTVSAFASGVRWDDLLVVGPGYVDYSQVVLPAGGALTIDEGWAPYAKGSMELPLTDPLLVEYLDPREGVRVDGILSRIDLINGGANTTVHSARPFNLGVRSRVLDHNSGIIRVDLASDEALLEDYELISNAPDFGATAYQSSLRALINGFVLSKIGASLAPNAGRRTNLVLNPRVTTASTNWSAAASSSLAGALFTRQTSGGPAGVSVNFMRIATTVAAAGDLYLYTQTSAVTPVNARRAYTLSCYLYSSVASTVSLRVDWYDAAGVSLGGWLEPRPLTANTWTAMKMTALAPEGAATARVYFIDSATFTMSAYFGATAVVFEEGITPGDFYDGGWTDTPDTDYSWAGTANASVSYATSLAALPDTTFYVLENASNLVFSGNTLATANGWSSSAGTVTFSNSSGQVPASMPTGSYRRTVTLTTAIAPSHTYTGNTTAPYSLISENTAYMASIWVRVNTAKSVTLAATFNTAAGAALTTATGAPVALAANVWTRVSLPVTSPATAARMGLVVTQTTAGVATNTLAVAGPLITENLGTPGISYVDYFDGSTTDTTDYNYAWTGTALLSSSTRTALQSRSPDLLRWDPGENLYDFVAPLLTQSGLRLFCDELRVWRLVAADYTVSGVVTIVEGFNAIEGTDTISRDNDGDWTDGVVVKYVWNDSEGVQQTAYDYAGSGSKGLLVEYTRPYPGPGAAAYILGRLDGRGRVQDVVAVQDYTATPSMAVSITLPNTISQTGQLTGVTWDMNSGRMQITSAGLTDTPDSAWIKLPVGESWNASAVGQTWIGEVV